MASDTKDRILDVAARLFEAHGFEGTAVSAILREAGVNSGSLYHFFPSKEGLLVSVLEHHLAALDSLLSDAARTTDDPYERVFALLELYRGRLLVSGYTRGCPIGDLALEIAARQPEARGIIDTYFGTWASRVSEWLEDASDRLPPHVDRDALALHALSVMQGAVMQARAAASVEPFDASVEQFRALLELLGGQVGRATGTVPRPVGRVVPAAAVPVAADAVPGVTGVEEDVERSRETGVAAEGPAWWRAW